MKKIIGLFLMLVTVLSMSACSQVENEALDKLARIKEEGVLKIGTNSGYPPFEFYDTRDGNKKLVGYDIDLGNEIAKELGVKAEFIDMDFDALIPSLISGKVDVVLAGIVESEDRKKSVDFSVPYLQNKTVVVAKKDQIDSLSNVNDFKGKKVVVQTATIQAATAQGLPEAEVIQLNSVGDTIAYLTSGQAQALLIAESSAKNIVNQFPDYAYTELTGMDEEDLIDGANVAVDKNQTKLVEAINEIITNLDKSGKLEEMFSKNVKLYDEVNKN